MANKEFKPQRTRGHRVDFKSFSANIPFFNKPSEKHSCFYEGLLKKGKPGGETAG
jgi:hypothetical protein